jgi:predicted nucleic acid-binding protein
MIVVSDSSPISNLIQIRETDLLLSLFGDVLLLARQRGLIDNVRSRLEKLDAAGFYLEENLRADVLRAAGEA